MGQFASRQQNGALRNQERLSKGLGWFSIGLGAAEFFAPGGIAGLIGVENSKSTRKLLRSYGLRELAAGVGILSQPDAGGWVWGRVAGDVMDLATLGSALASKRSNKLRLTTAALAVLGVTALDVFAGNELTSNGSKHPRKSRQAGRVSYSIIIARSPEEVYRGWRDLERLPEFMSWIESVRTTDERRSHWKAKIPGDIPVEWDAELIDDQPNRLIAWRSNEGAPVRVSGRVRFEPAPGGRGTLLTHELHIVPPGGTIGQKLTALFGKVPLRTVIENDLRRFKQILELGEIVKSDSSIFTGMHPAQPAAPGETPQESLRPSTLQPSLA